MVVEIPGLLDILGLPFNAVTKIVGLFRPKSVDHGSGPDVLIERIPSNGLARPLKSLIAGLTEAVIVIRNGQVVDVIHEGRSRTLNRRETVSSLFGLGPEVQAFKIKLHTFRVQIDFGGNNEPFITTDKSGDIPAGVIELTMRFDSHPGEPELENYEAAKRALWLIQDTARSTTRDEIKEFYQTSIWAAVQPSIKTMERGEITDLQGTMALEREIEAKLQKSFEDHGLVLDSIAIIWTLTAGEMQRIKDQERERESAEATGRIKRLEELINISGANTGGKGVGGVFVGGDYTSSQENGLNPVWIILLVGVMFAGIAAIIVLIR